MADILLGEREALEGVECLLEPGGDSNDDRERWAAAAVRSGGFYRTRVVPRLIDLAMRQDALGAYRARIVPRAAGRVLEIGAGSGLNLPHYGADVTSVIALDPSRALLEIARNAAIRVPVPVRWLEASAEAIPLTSGSADTVVSTWTLCSIPDLVPALSEIRRVLAPGGRLLFVEHGRAPEPAVERWQDRLTPIWKRLAGGCHLNRPVDRLLLDAGFRMEDLSAAYMDGPRIMTYMYAGSARAG